MTDHQKDLIAAEINGKIAIIDEMIEKLDIDKSRLLKEGELMIGEDYVS